MICLSYAQTFRLDLLWPIFCTLLLFPLAGLLLWGLIKYPAVGRIFATGAIAVWRLLAVLAIAAGVGLLVWGIVGAALGEQVPIGSPAAVIGVGAGSLTGGIALLVLSFVCRSANCRPQLPPGDQQ
jgi:hypothetical protein